MFDVFSPRRVVKSGERLLLRRAYCVRTRNGFQVRGVLLARNGRCLTIKPFAGERVTIFNWSRPKLTQLGKYIFAPAD